MRLQSTANVATDVPDRYAKQLASHLGRRVQVRSLPDGKNGYQLDFDYGKGEVLVEADRLILIAAAADHESLGRTQDVLGRHLERFGQRDNLVVRWSSP